jgi:hypothetical protein
MQCWKDGTESDLLAPDNDGIPPIDAKNLDVRVKGKGEAACGVLAFAACH